MADEKQQKPKPKQDKDTAWNKILDSISSFYRKTYYAPDDADTELMNMSNKINSSMNKIIDNINYTTGLTSLSSLYAKALDTKNAGGTVDAFEDLFGEISNDGGLYNAFFNNRSLRLFDAEIDMICKYMPMLEDALGVLCDNVVSSDHFSKDFIFISDSKVSDVTEEEFQDRIKILKDKYDLLQRTQEIIYDTSKYGERFIYVVPYEKAIRKLAMNRDRDNFVSESFTINGSTTVNGATRQTNINDKSGDVEVEIIFESANALTKEIVMREQAISRLMHINESSINESTVPMDGSLTPNDKLDAGDFYDDSSSNGLTVEKKLGTVSAYGLNGCLFKELNRYKVIPVHIDDIILGYALLENDSVFGLEEDFPVSDTTTPINSLGINKSTELSSNKNSAKITDEVIQTIASKLSTAIDDKFIKMNKDLSKEIYAILKSDIRNGKNKYKVTFLPPDDVVHCYFKLDQDTFRGVSDLFKSLIPAKLYIGLYITNTIGAMTRAQDRRVYYVKQSGIDTNISKVLLTTIDQLKRQNFNIRQLESMKNVLNIIGKFNDFVIPTDSSGSSPVQFEVMQGQQIDPQTDLMEKLQSMAVNGTDVPFELVQARQSMDYAIQATMSNSRFLKKVYNRQAVANRFLSSIMTKLYRGEFNDPTAVITVNLPQPMFLNLTNTNQFIGNANEIAQAESEAFAGDLPEEAKTLFLNNLKAAHLNTYIDKSMVAKVLEQTKIEFAKSQSANAGGGESY